MEISAEQWSQAKLLYEAALECDPSKRAEFLERNATDEVVREEVRRLLAQHEKLGSFLSVPAFAQSQPRVEDARNQIASGEVLAERFRIVRFIAAGGMGEVYQAEDLTLEEMVAIKTIRPEILQHKNILQRFKREVHLARRVTHPNICRVFDLFSHRKKEGEAENGALFVSMELLPGETLSEHIRRAGRYDTNEALPIINQIASGLEAAHKAGVIHRDLKPANVMLVPDGAENRIRTVITDFGLALSSGLDTNRSIDLTATEGLFGTPAYMAPEQIEGKPVTKLADIYAFGLIIYEMMTGEHAFPAGTPLASAAKRLSDPAVSPKRLAPQLSDAWEQTIIRCLQLNPNARYSSASEVANALGGQPIKTPVRPKANLFARCGPLVRIGLISVVLSGIIAAGYGVHNWLFKGHSTSVHAARRPTVAVLGLRNLSGKPDVEWISPALSQMLGTELAAGEKVRLIPTEQVVHGKIDLGLTNEGSLTSDTLARVRQVMGSDFVVLGSFLDIGGQIRIDLSMQDAVNGEILAYISDSGSERQLPDLATRMGTRLRRTLGVGEPSTYEAGYVKASQSSSIDATRLYSQGLEKLHSFNTSEAKDLFERAIKEDPNYALAHSALAAAWQSLGYNNKAADQAKIAMDLSGSLSREDRLAIEAQYRSATHDILREADIYRSLFTFYPDNLEYGLSLAKSQCVGAQLQEANSTLDVLQLLKAPDGDDPRIDYVRSAVAIAAGDYKKALTLSERVELRARQLGARRLVAQAGKNQCFLLSRIGDPLKAAAACDNAKTTFAAVGDYSGEADVWGNIAIQAADRGDNNTARMANDRQIAVLAKIHYDGGLAYAMTVAGELSATRGDYSRALNDYSRALAIYKKLNYQLGLGFSYGNLGWVQALQGDLKSAVENDQIAIDLIRKTNSKGELDIWMGDLADVLLAKGDIQGATRQLEDAFEINHETGDKKVQTYLRTSRSRLFLAKANLDEARREAEQAIKECLDLNDEAGAERTRVILAQVDIAAHDPQTAVETLRNALAYFKARGEKDAQIESRTILIEALLAMPSPRSQQEIRSLASAALNTENTNLKLRANIQIARARAALNDQERGVELLTRVISDAQRLGYEPQLFEARLAEAEIRLNSGNRSTASAQLEQIAEQADAKGLKLIATKATALLKREAS